ncbi:CapA family protein [uncultured Desulfobacter sp.]|uniref:CapA family protein n=1 Tax=uncultured Desulfobacter sp. TaxID=240139 RepID=UPI002AABFB6A|nr:CapA family protein [uncultured Desulfobacter sp.]
MGNKTVQFAAAGDFLLTARSSDQPGRGLEALSDEIQSLFKSCDLVFANLECTLEGNEKIPTEPRVLTTESQILSLEQSGIDCVSLGNNHAFDCYDQGFIRLREMLSDIGIRSCGAGLNMQEAMEPAIYDIQGIQLAIIGVVDRSSGIYRFAGESNSGVAPLETESVCLQIRELKQMVDHVIISSHWGMERFRIPSPEQMNQARAFADAGASLVLGHHPHVVQGMEMVENVPVVYSLGNFMSSHVYWDSGDNLDWNKFERVGCIFMCEFTKDNVVNIQQIPVYDDGVCIKIDKNGWADKCISKVNRLLASGVTQKTYDHEAFRVNKILPVLSHLSWQGLKKIRPGHFIRAYKKLVP